MWSSVPWKYIQSPAAHHLSWHPLVLALSSFSYYWYRSPAQWLTLCPPSSAPSLPWSFSGTCRPCHFCAQHIVVLCEKPKTFQWSPGPTWSDAPDSSGRSPGTPHPHSLGCSHMSFLLLLEYVAHALSLAPLLCWCLTECSPSMWLSNSSPPLRLHSHAVFKVPPGCPLCCPHLSAPVSLCPHGIDFLIHCAIYLSVLFIVCIFCYLALLRA